MKLSFVDTRPWVEKLGNDLYEIFSSDEDVEIATARDDDTA